VSITVSRKNRLSEQLTDFSDYELKTVLIFDVYESTNLLKEAFLFYCPDLEYELHFSYMALELVSFVLNEGSCLNTSGMSDFIYGYLEGFYEAEVINNLDTLLTPHLLKICNLIKERIDYLLGYTFLDKVNFYNNFYWDHVYTSGKYVGQFNLLKEKL